MPPVMSVIVFVFTVIGVALYVALLCVVAVVVCDAVVFHGDLKRSWLHSEQLDCAAHKGNKSSVFH